MSNNIQPVKVIVKPNPTQIVFTGGTFADAITGVTNLGTGSTLGAKSGQDITLKSLVAGDFIDFEVSSNEIKINASLSGATGFVTNATFGAFSASTESDISDLTNITNNNSIDISGNTTLINTLSGQTINKLDSVVGGTFIGVDNTDPLNPIINFTGVTGITGVAWGDITGTLSDQTDLQNTLNEKVNNSTFTGYTATTDTTLTNLRTDIDVVSGNTISNAGDIAYISGVTDTKIDKVSGATADNVPVLTSGGSLQDSGYSIAQLTGATSNVALSFEYRFDSSTTPPPASKEFELNNAVVSATTEIYVNVVTNQNVDISVILESLSTSDEIYIQNNSNPSEGANFRITGTPVDNTTYFTIPVTLERNNGAASWSNAQLFTFIIERDIISSWGDIIGTLSDQTDLQSALDAKLDISTFTGYTATTDASIAAIEADITYLSGATDTNTTAIGDNAADIVYLSGQTDLKLATSTFTGYTATTETRISGIESDVTYLSGQTDTKADKNLTIVSVTGATTLAEADNGKMIEADGTFTITIPTGLTTGWNVNITNVGSGTITIASNGTLQSKDSATQLASQYGGAVVYHRGSNNHLLAGDIT